MVISKEIRAIWVACSYSWLKICWKTRSRQNQAELSEIQPPSCRARGRGLSRLSEPCMAAWASESPWPRGNALLWKSSLVWREQTCCLLIISVPVKQNKAWLGCRPPPARRPPAATVTFPWRGSGTRFPTPRAHGQSSERACGWRAHRDAFVPLLLLTPPWTFAFPSIMIEGFKPW